VSECAGMLKAAGLASVLVTNGFVEEGPASDLLPLVDAMNLDIKSMDDEFYRVHCRAAVARVLRFAVQARKAGCHIEITNLVIPGLNDHPDKIRALADWVGENLGKRTPLHLSAYRPEYKMRIAHTPVATLEQAWAICRERLDYVYMGNVLTERGQDTVCPGCGALQVSRRGYSVGIVGIRAGACARCDRPADFIIKR